MMGWRSNAILSLLVATAAMVAADFPYLPAVGPALLRFEAPRPAATNKMALLPLPISTAPTASPVETSTAQPVDPMLTPPEPGDAEADLLAGG